MDATATGTAIDEQRVGDCLNALLERRELLVRAVQGATADVIV